MQKRKQRRAEKKADVSELDPSDKSAIEDQYDGFGEALFNAPSENKVLDSTFLGELKAVEVKDSDDEEYF